MIRIVKASSANAKSSSSAIILLIFVSTFGAYSNRVTTGPNSIDLICPYTPNFSNLSSKTFARFCNSSYIFLSSATSLIAVNISKFGNL